ncbi:MAG: ATP-grasp domain-containing protein [Chloroflexota bacterium]
MAIILQLGAGQWMRHSITQIQALGHTVHAIDRNPNAPAFDDADGHAPIDLNDTDGIVDYVRAINADAILAANEAGVLAAAEASQRLGLRGLHPEVALNALDKGRMRHLWREANLMQPEFVVVKTADELRQVAPQIGYPLVIKPTMNWGSRGTSFVETANDLDWAIDFASKHQRMGNFIVEKAVDGIEMTVEGLMQDGEVGILAKSDKVHQNHPKFRVAMEINYPANFPEHILSKTDQLIADAARALKMDDCAIHAEVMVSGDDVYLIEMGARPGGGHIFGQIVEACSGVSMPQALIQILLGEKINIQPRVQRGAVYRFFAPPAGIFVSVDGIEKAKQLNGVLDLGFHMAQGTVVDAIEGDADRPGFCVTTGATREDAMAIAEKALSMIHFNME